MYPNLQTMLLIFFSVLAMAVTDITTATISKPEVPLPVPLSVLVPKVEQKYVTVKPDGNKYTLTIALPNGSIRGENVELKEPGTPQQELSVDGTIIEEFEDGFTLRITYVAGKNGYVAKYSFGITEPDRLSPQTLKVLTG